MLRTNCRIAASFTKNKAAIKQRLSAQAYLELLAVSDDAEEDSGEEESVQEDSGEGSDSERSVEKDSGEEDSDQESGNEVPVQEIENKNYVMSWAE